MWGVAIIGFGLAPTLWLAVLCLAVSGAADMVSAVLRTSMLQEAAPDEMRGRMQGVFLVVVAGGPRLGDLRAGAMASMAGVSVAMVSGGVIIVVAMAVVAVVVPSFWWFRASDGAGRQRRRPGRARPPPRVARAGRAPRSTNHIRGGGTHRRRTQPECGCLATLSWTSMFPAVALEYGQIWWVRSISARAFSSSISGAVNSSSTARPNSPGRTLEEVHAGGDVRALEVLRREPDVLEAVAHRAVEAGRVAGGEQLFRIGARSAVAAHLGRAAELQVEPVVGGDHRAGALPVGLASAV